MTTEQRARVRRPLVDAWRRDCARYHPWRRRHRPGALAADDGDAVLHRDGRQAGPNLASPVRLRYPWFDSWPSPGPGRGEAQGQDGCRVQAA